MILYNHGTQIRRVINILLSLYVPTSYLSNRLLEHPQGHTSGLCTLSYLGEEKGVRKSEESWDPVGAKSPPFLRRMVWDSTEVKLRVSPKYLFCNLEG